MMRKAIIFLLLCMNVFSFSLLSMGPLESSELPKVKLSRILCDSKKTLKLRFLKKDKGSVFNELCKDRSKDGGFSMLTKVYRLVYGMRTGMSVLEKRKIGHSNIYDFIFKNLKKEYLESGKNIECLSKEAIEKYVILYLKKKLHLTISKEDICYPKNFLKYIDANLPGYGTVKDFEEGNSSFKGPEKVLVNLENGVSADFNNAQEPFTAEIQESFLLGFQEPFFPELQVPFTSEFNNWDAISRGVGAVQDPEIFRLMEE